MKMNEKYYPFFQGHPDDMNMMNRGMDMPMPLMDQGMGMGMNQGMGMGMNQGIGMGMNQGMGMNHGMGMGMGMGQGMGDMGMVYGMGMANKNPMMGSLNRSESQAQFFPLFIVILI